jgi:hypothetical protein
METVCTIRNKWGGFEHFLPDYFNSRFGTQLLRGN